MAKPKPVDAKALTAKVKSYVALREQIKTLEDAYAILKEELQEIAIAAGGAVDTPTHVVKMVEQERRSISKDRLVELGVTPKVIDKATIVTPVSFVRVDAKKEAA